jgi:hypothetical protein
MSKKTLVERISSTVIKLVSGGKQVDAQKRAGEILKHVNKEEKKHPFTYDKDDTGWD